MGIIPAYRGRGLGRRLIEAALQQGADRAREIAEPTMAEVHSAMGLGPLS